MYNALNSIQALILNRDIENSNMYLSKFSNLMRKVLDASGKETINLHEEIEILQLYLDLEKLRFGDDLNFSIHINPEMDTYAIHLPAMLLQPYVENALKHGLLHKKGQKQLRISFAKKNQHLLCEITDNGVGRAKSDEIQRRRSKAHHSFATSANEKRLELLNTYGNMRYQVEIIDLYEGTEARGTTVRIEIPLTDDLES
jgi:LytS/YehU family sensor histidine kinase